MPRKDRIEYEHAYYHVMNRGRGRRTIFPSDAHYQAFLDILQAACDRFGGIMHAYCLMGNHYHLLIETPLANLSRIMRHINGVYTQKHNRLKRTDGPLFRGRYKAIVVDADSYLLQLSRYIHRNPIETKPPLVQDLSEYRWSSYPAYINKASAIPCLNREQTYQMLGNKQRYRGYADFVHEGIDPEIQQYYNKRNVASVLGDKAFKSWLHDDVLPEITSEEKAKITHTDTSMADIIVAVSRHYRQKPTAITKCVKGPLSSNEARKLAMYLSQEVAGETLQKIANHFGLAHRGSVSYITHQVRLRLKNDKAMKKKIDKIISIL